MRRSKRFLSIYLTLLAINLFFTGFVGIKPAITALNKKIRLQKELLAVRDSLKDKQAVLNALKNDLDTTQEEREDLDKVIPHAENIDTYLIDIVKTAATQGFELLRFNKSSQKNNSTEIGILVTGDVYKIGSLLEAFENLQRLTSVNSIKMDFNKKSPSTIINLEIYFTGETT